MRKGAGSGRSLSPSTGEVGLGGIEVLGHSWLHSKFEAETSYIETLSQRTKQISKNQKDVFYEEEKKNLYLARCGGTRRLPHHLSSVVGGGFELWASLGFIEEPVSMKHPI